LLIPGADDLAAKSVDSSSLMAAVDSAVGFDVPVLLAATASSIREHARQAFESRTGVDDT
jgi:hypothetical protein